MTQPAFVVLDTETGGLDPRVNPLLSVAVLVAGGAPDYQHIDGFQVKVLPPENTWMEIPTPDTVGLHQPRKRLAGYRHAHSGASATELPAGALVLSAYAMEVNHYVGIVDGKWDFSPMQQWMSEAFEVTKAEQNIRQYLAQVFQGKRPLAVAHNAQFDQRFINAHMPLLEQDLYPQWFCTLAASKEYWKKQGVKHSAKLTEMAKVAGYDYSDKAHDAFEDVKATLKVLAFLKAA